MSVATPAFIHLIRQVADFPHQGILFRDIMPLLADAHAFADCIAAMAAPWQSCGVQQVLAIEARGFIFGAALAQLLGTGLVPLRKAGKLPGPVIGVDFQLEYGQARLEVQAGIIPPGSRVLIVDDVLATGGTLAAACSLASSLQAEIIGATVVAELPALKGREQWSSTRPLHALTGF